MCFHEFKEPVSPQVWEQFEWNEHQGNSFVSVSKENQPLCFILFSIIITQTIGYLYFQQILTHLEYFDLFPQQSLGLSQILFVDAFDCHLPVMFLETHIRRKVSWLCVTDAKDKMYSINPVYEKTMNMRVSQKILRWDFKRSLILKARKHVHTGLPGLNNSLVII